LSTGSPPKIPYARAWNIALRTAHIAVTGILFGGHVFDIPAATLYLWLYLTILTGAVLVFLEAYPHVYWIYQGRGVFVLVKLLLLCLIPWLWEYRVAILVVVIIIASAGSHMPARFRYFSVVHGTILGDHKTEPAASPPPETGDSGQTDK
jgi:hypothetical protein